MEEKEAVLTPSTAKQAWGRHKQYALSQRSPMECLNAICAVAVDYDGARTAAGLAHIIDEMWALAMRGADLCDVLDSDDDVIYRCGHKDGQELAKMKVVTAASNSAHVACRVIRERLEADGITTPGWMRDYEERKKMFDWVSEYAENWEDYRDSE